MKRTFNTLIHSSWLELACRWTLGAAFIYASYHKIIDPAQFAKVIYGYYLFPASSINLIAIILPFMELFCGLALVLGIYPRSAGLILNLMLCAFIAALSINLIRGQEFDCGCFSFEESGYGYSATQLLMRDIVLLAAGIWVIFFPQRRKWSLRQTGSVLQNIGPVEPV